MAKQFLNRVFPMKRWIVSLCMLCLAVQGCSTLDQTFSKSVPGPALAPLRIGVTPDYPPLVFRREGRVSGLEVDFANALCTALGRRAVLVELPWEDQLVSLNEGKIDIVMSGMSVTPARELRATFCDSYVKSGLVAVVPSRRVDHFTTAESVVSIVGTVGVVPGTTAATFVQRQMKSADVVSLKKMTDAKLFFEGNSIKMMVQGVFGAAWLVASNESDLAGVWIPLTEEPLAWAVRRNDPELLASINTVLAGWRRDGTLDHILDRWVEVRKKIQWDRFKIFPL